MTSARFALLLTFLAAANIQAQSVAGVATDASGSAIPGVTVTATPAAQEGGAAVAVTDMAGAFHLTGLRPGGYEIEATLEGFQTIARKVTLVTGQALDLKFKLVAAMSETIEVVAQAAKTGEVAILDSRRQAAVVSDSISAEEIRKTPDSSAAGVVERLTGVTLLGDKYVFVRGLGERYSGTTINGATLPTTETEKRVVPLDLFPAKLLETVSVVKTYTPDKPGDFGSGVVEMTTIEFPSSRTLRFSAGAGYQDATGSNFRRYAGGLSRWGNGGQAMPPAIPAGFVRRSSMLSPGGFTPLELEQFGESVIGDWTGAQRGAATPATDFSLTYGNTFGSLGVVLSAVSNHRFETTDEELRFFGLDAEDVLVPRNDYTMVADRESANVGMVGNFSVRLNDSHRLFLNTVLTRDASSEDRVQEGLNTNSGGNIRDFRGRYQLEQIFSARLRGEHNLQGLGIGSLVEWNAARSQASNDSDLRENLYREIDPGVYSLNTGAAEAGKVDFHTLDDSILQGGAAYTVFYAGPSGRVSGALKGGVDHLSRTRDFAARRFRFNAVGSLQGVDLTATPGEIFTAENIGPDGFELREVTGVNDAYDAEHTIDAVYLMADSSFGRWRFIGGARYEDSDQRVTTFNPFDVANEVNSINQGRDVLPSFNVVFQASPRTNIRAAYGRSLNRPEFRELSPFAFTEVSGGRSIIGNANLEQATLDSFDLRWEQFPTPSDVVAASVFYKRIAKPIERVIQPTTELRTSFVNADSATLWGAELEFRRSLDIVSPALRFWSVNANYAYVRSDVTVGQQELSVVTNLERPLEGQSDQVANLALQFYQPDWGTMFRFLTSYTGKRVTDVGAYGLPDIYEAGYASVDAVVSQRLNHWRGIELKIAANNLLAADRRFLQAGAVQRRYEPGRSMSVSLSYTPF